MYMDKGGAAIHLDPPNISWISTIFVFPTYSCLQCISKCALFILYYFYVSEDPCCASIRRRGPGDADGMVHDDYFSVRGGSREDIRAPLGMGGLS
jgi:hypothetical protein